VNEEEDKEEEKKNVEIIEVEHEDEEEEKEQGVEKLTDTFNVADITDEIINNASSQNPLIKTELSVVE